MVCDSSMGRMAVSAGCSCRHVPRSRWVRYRYSYGGSERRGSVDGRPVRDEASGSATDHVALAAVPRSNCGFVARDAV
jgi:hypothetical protein